MLFISFHLLGYGWLYQGLYLLIHQSLSTYINTQRLEIFWTKKGLQCGIFEKMKTRLWVTGKRNNCNYFTWMFTISESTSLHQQSQERFILCAAVILFYILSQHLGKPKMKWKCSFSIDLNIWNDYTQFYTLSWDQM